MKVLLSILFCFFVFSNPLEEKKLVSVHRTVNLMGSKFDITVVAENEEIGYVNIEEAISEIERIDKMLYEGDKNSETFLINANA
ncbi:MAG: FAD:protein FMN transferase, partial [Arenibacter latericius]|nr:FAD:protein FMN transferase [Arenibacter latericius]